MSKPGLPHLRVHYPFGARPGMETPVTARAALLQALLHGEGFGLDLIARVGAMTGGAITLGQGSIYPALHDLEGEGLVRSRDGEPRADRGGRSRRYYRLTAAGVRVAKAHRETLAALFGGPKP